MLPSPPVHVLLLGAHFPTWPKRSSSALVVHFHASLHPITPLSTHPDHSANLIPLVRTRSSVSRVHKGSCHTITRFMIHSTHVRPYLVVPQPARTEVSPRKRDMHERRRASARSPPTGCRRRSARACIGGCHPRTSFVHRCLIVGNGFGGWR